MKIKLAENTPDNLAITVRLRREAAAWLESQGQDQWVHVFPDTATMVDGFSRDLREKTTWFALDDAGDVLATITINRRTAAGLWTPAEEASAIFVHRLTLSRRAAGQGIGAQLLDFAGQQAAEAGLAWVRLDAWTTNQRLHAYYVSQGFRLVRVIADHHTPSGACFERPSEVRAARPMSDLLDPDLLAQAAAAGEDAEAADAAPIDSDAYRLGLVDGARVTQWYIGGGPAVAGYDPELFMDPDYRRGLRHAQAAGYERAAVEHAMAAGDLCPDCGAAGGVSDHSPACRFRDR